MIKRILVLFLGACTSLLFGQLDSNSVTVTASRSSNLQPDQVLFAVYVTSSVNTSLDEVLAAVKASGITIANFSGVGTSTFQIGTGAPLPQPELQWAFGLPVPFAQMKATLTALNNLQQSIAQANNGLTLAFSVQGAQVSAALQQSQTCSVSDLISDASAQAHKLANAAGLTIGSILAMSSLAVSPVVRNNVPGALIGAFGTGSSSGTILVTAQNCVLTVKFGLTRF